MKKQKTTDNFQEIFVHGHHPKSTNDSVLVRANDTYNKLVNQGLLKKRGYTLRGIEDAHLFRSKFNGY
jgi:chromosome condensin MukBEF complex kleisin-like MukF subunit